MNTTTTAATETTGPRDDGLRTADQATARAAATALRQAIALRDESLRRSCAFDRRIDRSVMRDYALEWRVFTGRPGELSDLRLCGIDLS